MISDTKLNRAALATFSTGLSLVAPTILILTLARLTNYSSSLPLPLPLQALLDTRAAQAWMAIELFFLGWFLSAYRTLQHTSTYDQLSAQERSALWSRVIHNIPDPTAYFSLWFSPYSSPTRPATPFAAIRRGNIEEWVAWVCFGLPAPQVEATPKWEGELARMTDLLEAALNYRFPPGIDPGVHCVRLNQDPFYASHRPFFFYAIVFALDAAAKALLRTYGFRRFGRSPRTLSEAILFPTLPSPPTSDLLSLTYWYRPPTPASPQPSGKTPLVLVHGIGIGLLPYLPLLFRILTRAPDSPIYLIELPHVSMRLHTSPSPPIPTIVTEMAAALRERAHPPALWVGHSLGSAIVAGACRWAPSAVAATVFVDPICFLLHYPDVASHFVHRRALPADQHFIEYFASRELSISRYISRDFQWWHASLFPEELSGPSTVFLSTSDVLVPSLSVKAFLSAANVKSHLMPFGHAGFITSSLWESRIADEISRHLSPPPTPFA